MRPAFRPHPAAVLAASLVAIAALGLSACGSSRPSAAQVASDARSEVVAVIADPQQRQAVLAEIDRWEALVAERLRCEADFLARRDALNADYAATLADFQALQQQHEVVMQRTFTAFVDIRQRIIAHTSADEWNRLRSTREELSRESATVGTGAKP